MKIIPPRRAEAMTTPLRPFWRYYGGKWANARRYEPPRFGVIVEPFAGAAGYSLHHHDQGVVLVEKNPVVAAVWSWLITASPSDVLDIPDLPDSGEVADIDAPKPARDLVVVNPRIAAHVEDEPLRSAREGELVAEHRD